MKVHHADVFGQDFSSTECEVRLNLRGSDFSDHLGSKSQETMN